MRKRLFGGIILILGAFVACGPQRLEPEETCNFVQSNEIQRVSWKTKSPISLTVDGSVPAKYFEAIQRAAGQWDRALGRRVFQIESTSAVTSQAQDSKSTITWVNNWNSAADNKGPSEQASTVLYFYRDRIVEADIRINAQYFSFAEGPKSIAANEVDLESLVVHEMGHVLGLTHIDSQSSVMYKNLQLQQERREPDPEVVSSVKCEYDSF